jgi:hypothetical protein
VPLLIGDGVPRVSAAYRGASATLWATNTGMPVFDTKIQKQHAHSVVQSITMYMQRGGNQCKDLCTFRTQSSHLHEAVTSGQTHYTVFSCCVSCLPFSRLRDPAMHWLGYLTCETDKVIFKHMTQDESSSVCCFECTHWHAGRRNADGLDWDCVQGVLMMMSFICSCRNKK